MVEFEMTEDDTFRVLKRTPYIEMWNIWETWILDLDHISPAHDFIGVLEENGWTFNEFDKARARIHDSR